MKVAIAWNYPSRLVHCSFRFEQYVKGFRELGHETVIVCTEDAGEGFDAPKWLIPNLNAFREGRLWKQIGADVAVIVTWHRMSDVLSAIAAAGTRVVAFADTDGRPGSRLFWRFNLQRQIHYRSGWREQSRFLARWLCQQIRERAARVYPEDQEAIKSTAFSDLVAVGHQAGRDNLIRFFRFFEVMELSKRIEIVPFAIAQTYLACSLPAVKEDRVVAIGRWNDPQKNAPLLVAALKRILNGRPQTEVQVLGMGGESFFAPLLRQFSSFLYRGVQGQHEVASILAGARAIVFASRWEGCPHAALEMLALGGTVVGTPLPSLQSWSESGRFGRIASRSTARALASAIHREMEAWDNGQRDLRSISEHWRAQLQPKRICERLLGAGRSN